MERLIDITPYKELCGGDNADSIHNHTQPGYIVPQKVITYLQVGEAFLMCPGIYDHPFKLGTRLLGPYLYSDGQYCWDRDTWKYVLKYHLTLPQDFIDHVMTVAGTAYIEKRLQEEDDWAKTIKNWKTRQDMLCLLPDDVGDVSLDEF